MVFLTVRKGLEQRKVVNKRKKKLLHDKTPISDQWKLQSAGLLQLLGCVAPRWSASITSYKRASACQSDVHQGCTSVGQRGAIIPGSAPMVLALPPLSPPSFPLHPPSLHAVVFLLSSPGRGCLDHAAWPGCQWRDPGRGSGATGEAWAQSTPLHPASPSTSPGCQLPQPSPSPCPAGQSSHICVPCNLGTRGMEEGRRVIVKQAGRGPMWTSCLSEILTGSVPPTPPRLITLLIFINSWVFFMPCRPEIDREGGKEGGMETEVEGQTPLHSTTTTTAAEDATKTTTPAAGAQC